VKDPKDFDPFVHDPIRQDIGKPRHPQLVDADRRRGWLPEIGVIDQFEALWTMRWTSRAATSLLAELW